MLEIMLHLKNQLFYHFNYESAQNVQVYPIDAATTRKIKKHLHDSKIFKCNK
jgi:hypothetical protein